MNLATVERLTPRTDWVLMKQRTKMVALCVFCAAAGGWVQSIRDHAATIPYKDRSTAQLETLKDAAGPNPAATVRCLKRKAEKAEALGTAAVANSVADGDDTADLISKLEALPDCPTPKL